MSRVPARAHAAPSRVIDGQAVVIHTRLAEVSMLNDAGSVIWAAIDGVRDEAAIAARVADEFEIPPEDAARDVAAFLDELASADLVEWR